MFGGFWRIVFCLLLFGMGASAVRGWGAPEGVAVVLSGIVALGANYAWREQQRRDLAREHREAVEADTETRIATAQRVLAAAQAQEPLRGPQGAAGGPEGTRAG